MFHSHHYYDFKVDVTIRNGPAGPVEVDEVFKTLVTQQLSTIITQGEKLMAFTAAQTKAIQDKLDDMEQKVTTAVSTATAEAVAKELDEIKSQLQKLRDIIAEGGTVSDADVAQVIGSVDATGTRMATNLGTAIAAAIDKISEDDGGTDTGSGGGTPTPNPNPEP
jgi:hypothetical protein